jgi:hypothetical protein
MNAGIDIHKTATGCMLVSQAIEIGLIKRVTMMTNPKLTIYTRPTDRQIRACPSEVTSIRCLACRHDWSLGTWLCLNCWEPLNFQAINDQESLFAGSHSERDNELWRRYSINRVEFEELRTEHGSALAGIMLAPYPREGPTPDVGALPKRGGARCPLKRLQDFRPLHPRGHRRQRPNERHGGRRRHRPLVVR